jgi:hypothetical protein
MAASAAVEFPGCGHGTQRETLVSSNPIVRSVCPLIPAPKNLVAVAHVPGLRVREHGVRRENYASATAG